MRAKILTLVCFGAIALFCWLGGGVHHTRGPLPRHAYLWQRAWTPQVTESIKTNAAEFHSVCVLSAEASWKGGSLQIARAKLDYDTLAAAKTRVGIALRIGPFRGPFSSHDRTATALAALAASLLAECSVHSLDVAELQIDFDCASAKLDGYAQWLQAIRARSGSVPLIITALPSWLKQSSFSRLTAAVDGFVLQVHSLERPKSSKESFILCDPRAARGAVERAAKFGKPFRVALPTYGYTVAFDRADKFIGLSAEGPQMVWSAGAIIRETMADPDAMADLVRTWTASRPEFLTGIIWYRLPVRGERLNWTWRTLAAVMDGRTPAARIVPQLRYPAAGLVEVTLANEGERNVTLPAIVLEWKEGRCFAGDGLGGFHLDTRDQHSAFFKDATEKELRPGELRKIGWLRFDSPVDVQVRTF